MYPPFLCHQPESHPSTSTINETTRYYTACMRTYLDDCERSFPVGIRLCDGRIEYLLEHSSTQSGYCFGMSDKSTLPLSGPNI